MEDWDFIEEEEKTGERKMVDFREREFPTQRHVMPIQRHVTLSLTRLDGSYVLDLTEKTG